MRPPAIAFPALVLMAAVALAGTDPPPPISLASRASDGTPLTFGGHAPALSRNGRWLAFSALRGGVYGVLVKDLRTGALTDASLALDGTPAHGSVPSISADGRYVAFTSLSDALVPGDDNGSADIFVRDLATGAVQRVSVSEDGAQADRGSGFAAISADGRRVAFTSSATNLVPGDDNQTEDVFVKDLPSGRLWRVSVNAAGRGSGNGMNRPPAISSHGRYIAFHTADPRLDDSDTNNDFDIFLADVKAGTLQRASVAADGSAAERGALSPALSADGRWLAFHSAAANLVPGDANGHVDVFVKDLHTGAIRIGSRRADGGAARGGRSAEAALSGDGRFLAFESLAGNLVDDTANGRLAVFLKDLETGAVRRLSMSADGVQGNKPSTAATLSGNGRVFGFESPAGNLVDDDLNGAIDVFVGPAGDRQ